jgi:hypothetical protein
VDSTATIRSTREDRTVSSSPNGLMSFSRAVAIRDQCAADLAEARRQGHQMWVFTLARRLEKLDALVAAKRALVPLNDPKRAGERTS